MPLPAGAVSLYGHVRNVRRVVFLPDERRVVTACEDCRARVYDAHTGALQLVFSEHETYVTGLAVLGSETVSSGDGSGVLCVWCASTGRCLYRTRTAGGGVSSIAPLDGMRFVAGTCDGTLVFYHGRCGPISVLQSVRKAHADAIPSIATHGRRMVTGSWDTSAKVWGVDDREACGTLRGNAERVQGVAIDGKHIVTVTGGNVIGGKRTGELFIWDACNFSLLSKLEDRHANWIFCPLILGEGKVLTVSGDRTILVTDMATGVSVHRIDLSFSIRHAATDSAGRIAACGGGRSAVIFPAPQPIHSMVCARLSSAVGDFPPAEVPGQPMAIKGMLAKLCAGEIGAEEAVAKALRPDACGACISEFFHAHHLAMIAVKHGGVPGETSFYFTEVTTETDEDCVVVETSRKIGALNFWFENLYCCARKLLLTEKTMCLVRICLAEAANAGLIEGTESALTGIALHRDLCQEMEVVHSAGIQICRLLVELQERYRTVQSSQLEMEREFNSLLDIKDKQLDALAASFRRFKQKRAIAHLVGFGVHLIPFVGGLFAEAVTGAAAVAEISKDLLGAAVGMYGESHNVIADRILVKAGESVDALDGKPLFQARLVAKLGIGGVCELQQMFVRGRANICSLSESDIAVEFALIVQRFSGVLALTGDPEEDVLDSDYREGECGSTSAGNSGGNTPVDSGECHVGIDDSEPEGSAFLSALPDFSALKLVRREITVAEFEKMLDWEIVDLISADLVSFNPRHGDRFERIRVSLTAALEIVDVCAGDDLVRVLLCQQ